MTPRPISTNRMFPVNHAYSSTSGPSSTGTGLTITTVALLEALSTSPSTSRVMSNDISFSTRLFRLSSLTVRNTVIDLDSCEGRTKSLSSWCTRASNMLKKMSELRSMSARRSWSSVGWRLVTVKTNA